MTPDPPAEITRLLRAWAGGDQAALDRLTPLVYSELRKVAGCYMRKERPGHTLQTTALVHEAYLRLVDVNSLGWQDRAHFFAVAAEAMRRILVENARRKRRLRHGGQFHRVSLDEADVAIEPPEEGLDLIELDAALESFAVEEPRKSELVKLRYFAGLSEPEAADVLGISRPTAARWWAFARAWLYERMQGQEAARQQQQSQQ